MKKYPKFRPCSLQALVDGVDDDDDDDAGENGRNAVLRTNLIKQ